MNERLGTKRGKTIPGVDVLNATWLTSPPQAVLEATRTARTTEAAAAAATTAAAAYPGDIAPAEPPPQQQQQPEEAQDAELAQPQQQQQPQEQEHPPGAEPDVELDAAAEQQVTDQDVTATADVAHPLTAAKKKRRRNDKPRPPSHQRRKAKARRLHAADAEQSAT